MRKIYSLIASVAMGLVALTANAASYDIPEENGVLQSEAYNYRLYKNVNLNGLEINGVAIDGITFDTGITTTEFKFNGYEPFRCTTDGLTFLWQSVGNIAYASGWGLRNTGSGPRGLHIADLKKGQILVLQGVNGGYNTAETNTEYNAFCIPNGSRYNANSGWLWEYTNPLIVEDISDEIHALQDAAGGGEDAGEEGGEATAVHDHFLYLRVIEDGVLNLPLERSAGLLGFQIWIDAEAEEAISAPSLKVISVNYDDRDLEFKAGESTLGMEVKTYYSKDGSDPIYLKDSEEVDYVEYIYETDEEGNPVLDEEGNPVVAEEIPHYKKVLDTELAEKVGSYGENDYDGSGAITIYGSDDEDGDGYVVVKAASVNEETGAYSEIVTVNVAVGTIQLNQPTLTLQGFDGTSRSYSIGWNNNTLCGEEFSFIVNGDEGELYDETLTVGSLINIENDVTVTVHAEGYNDGEVYIMADYQGVDIHRKNAAEDEEGNPIHDWDFTNLTENQKAIVQGTIIEGYYKILENGDSVVCSYEDYRANDGIVNVNGVDVDFTDGGVEIMAPTCWYWDAGNQRATLNVIEGGNNVNANGYGYVEDKANIFHDMLVNCAPNASNNSCIFIYIGRANGSYGNLGAYFMARPEFTFSRSVAAAGEFVLIQGGTGGSNWTNAPYPIIKQVPEDGLLTVNGLPSGGYHIFYIDVYTSDELPEDLLENADEAWKDAVAIEGVTANGKAVAGIYSVSGAKLSAPQKGINIVKYTDGTAAKVLVK